MIIGSNTNNYTYYDTGLKTDTKKPEKESPAKYTIEAGPFYYRSHGSTSSIGINIFKIVDLDRNIALSPKAVKVKLVNNPNDQINSNIQGYTVYGGNAHRSPVFDLNKELNIFTEYLSEENIGYSRYNGSLFPNIYSHFFGQTGKGSCSGTNYDYNEYWSGWGGKAGYRYNLRGNYDDSVKLKAYKFNLLNFEWNIGSHNNPDNVGCAASLFFNSSFNRNIYSENLNLKLWEVYSYYGGEGTTNHPVAEENIKLGFKQDTYSVGIGIALDINYGQEQKPSFISNPYIVRFIGGIKYQYTHIHDLNNITINQDKFHNFMIYFGLEAMRLDLNFWNFK